MSPNAYRSDNNTHDNSTSQQGLWNLLDEYKKIVQQDKDEKGMPQLYLPPNNRISNPIGSNNEQRNSSQTE